MVGSKSGKEYVKAVYCHCSLNLYAEYITRNAGVDEAQAGIKIAGKNTDNLRYTDDFIGRTDAEAETPILWPPEAKN